MATPDGEPRLGEKELPLDDPAALALFQEKLGGRLAAHASLSARDQATLANIVFEVGRSGLSQGTEEDAFAQMAMIADLAVAALVAGSTADIQGVLRQKQGGAGTDRSVIQAAVAQATQQFGAQMLAVDKQHGGRLGLHMQKVFAQGGAASPAETEQKFLPDIDPEATERVVHAMRGLLMTALVQPTLSEGSAAMRDLAGAFSRSDLQQRKILILGACSPSDEH